MITARRFTSTKILDFCTIPFITSMPMKMRDRRCQGQRPTSSSSCVALTRNYGTISERQNEYSSPGGTIRIRPNPNAVHWEPCRSCATRCCVIARRMGNCGLSLFLGECSIQPNWAQGYLRKLIWPHHHTDSKANKYIVSPLIHVRWLGLIHLHWLV